MLEMGNIATSIPASCGVFIFTNAAQFALCVICVSPANRVCEPINQASKFQQVHHAE
jgi:hypothetical protein